MSLVTSDPATGHVPDDAVRDVSMTRGVSTRVMGHVPDHVPRVFRGVSRVSRRVTSRRPSMGDVRALDLMSGRALAGDVTVRATRAVATGDPGQQPNAMLEVMTSGA